MFGDVTLIDSSSSEDSEYTDELLGYSMSTPDWRTPVTDISISIAGGPNLPSTQASVLEIVPTPMKFEKIGKNFVVQTNPGLLTRYSEYLRNLRGKYEETTGQWTFPSSQEQNVRNILNQIFSGQLPPPDQLAPANQINIDLSTATSIPTTHPIIQAPAQILQSTNIQVPQPSRGRGRGRPVKEPSIPPSQIIASTLGTQYIQTLPPSVINQPQGQIPLPEYSPLDKEIGESQAEYDVRKYLYQYLANNQIPPDTADILSRMRNNVDVQGVGYNQYAMNILNSYLPR